jgi:hypothetical protein
MIKASTSWDPQTAHPDQTTIATSITEVEMLIPGPATCGTILLPGVYDREMLGHERRSHGSKSWSGISRDDSTCYYCNFARTTPGPATFRNSSSISLDTSKDLYASFGSIEGTLNDPSNAIKLRMWVTRILSADQLRKTLIHWISVAHTKHLCWGFACLKFHSPSMVYNLVSYMSLENRQGWIGLWLNRCVIMPHHTSATLRTTLPSPNRGSLAFLSSVGKQAQMTS